MALSDLTRFSCGTTQLAFFGAVIAFCFWLGLEHRRQGVDLIKTLNPITSLLKARVPLPRSSNSPVRNRFSRVEGT